MNKKDPIITKINACRGSIFPIILFAQINTASAGGYLAKIGVSVAIAIYVIVTLGQIKKELQAQAAQPQIES